MYGNSSVRASLISGGQLGGLPLLSMLSAVLDAGGRGLVLCGRAGGKTLSDGSVWVFSSLMDIMTDAGLLGVIGHEIGHVAKRRSKKAFKTSLMTGASLDCVSSAGGRAARLTESQLGAMSEALVNARFSQKQEREADNYGFDFLKSNNRNPWCMSMSFRRLQQMEQEGGGGEQNIIDRIFASHPDTEDRIEAMEERARSEGFERP